MHEQTKNLCVYVCFCEKMKTGQHTVGKKSIKVHGWWKLVYYYDKKANNAVTEVRKDDTHNS